MDAPQISQCAVEAQQHWQEVFPLAYGADGALEDIALVERWVLNNRDTLLAELDRHGAVLLRGLPITDSSRFDRVVQAFALENFTYDNSLSNAVRHNVTERVFTANEAPPQVAIYLHHEMAQTPYYPSRLFFYCEQAAETGGATPLCRSDVLLEKLKQQIPAFVDQCRSRGVRYMNVMPGTDDAASGQGRSWRRTLRVDDRSAAEEKLRRLGYSWEWLDQENLRVTTAALPAIRQLADGREVFFNQIIAAYRGWQDTRNEASKSISYGDGTAFDEHHLETLQELSDALTFELTWKTGDLALVDNFLVMHGRRPFSGKRRVLASLVA